jgi:Na+(H+)/acetate symporter ActP
VTASNSAQTAALIMFSVLATLAMLLCILTGSEPDDLADFYTGYRTLTPLRNGLAVAGDYVSAATVLSTSGVIALSGYDGVVLVLSTVLSLLLLMRLLAEPLRTAGRFTMGDVLARRMPGRAVRGAACAVTLAASLPLLLVQLSVGGSLLTFILGISVDGAKAACICVVGALMIGYAAMGGMKGTALVQIIKMVMLFGASLAVTLLVLSRFHWNPAELLSAARQGSGAGEAYLRQGLEFGSGARGRLDFFSVQISVVLGAGCLPHVIMRMNGGTSSSALRRSMSWAVGSTVLIAMFVTVMGTAAAALVGHQMITANDPQGSTSLMLLSSALGMDYTSIGEAVLFAAIGGAIFMTLLASVAGLTLAAATSVAHDLYAGVRHRERATERDELAVARWTILGIGLVAIVLAVLVRDWNLQVLIATAFCVGASAVAPALVYSLFWRGYTRTGLLCTLVGGTVCVLALMTFSRAVSGGPDALFPHQDFHWFPLRTTGIVSVPVGFLSGWLGSRFGSRLGWRSVVGALRAAVASSG